MAHKPKYAKQEPRRNTALKLLPLVLVAVVAVVLIVRSVGKGKPDDAPTTPPTTEEAPPSGAGCLRHRRRSGRSADAQARDHRLHHRGWRLRF